MSGTLKIIDKNGGLMECQMCGKLHSPILIEEGEIPEEAFNCTAGCEYPEGDEKENI